MPRNGRRKILGKRPLWEQWHREKELRQLLQEVRAAWRSHPSSTTSAKHSDSERSERD